MADALIGHTGFVGGNLLRQTRFDDLYNSKNIESLKGRHYQQLVCSGAPAEKWKANQAPAADLENIQRLMGALEGVRVERFILMSTVDVFPVPRGMDEASDVASDERNAYGRHRLLLERFVTERFPGALIVRLPGLFGHGLKKNVIYDFLNNNRLEFIESRGSFQFYPLVHLWKDIQTALSHGLQLVHFATAPITVREVAREGFGMDFTRELQGTPASYDFRSRHAHLFGGHDGYLYEREQVFGDLRAFVASQRQEAPKP